MLHKASTLKGYKLHSLDGDIGKVREFYFDDKHWAIRYMVADTGSWLTGRQVLISPYALVTAIEEEQSIAVNLTTKQIEDSPSLETNKPVSRQFEAAYYGYYGWPGYWGGAYMWGGYPYPYLAWPYPRIARGREELAEADRIQDAWDPHLRSTHDVSGHHIQATDGQVGHVEDFIIDDESWAIRYLVIDTKNWWPGKKVLVSPQWIERVSWEDSKVFVNLSRDTIKRSPEYTDKSLLTREYEDSLYRHYGREGYWADDLVAAEYSR